MLTTDPSAQLIDRALERFDQAHPRRELEIPAPLKWAAAIIASVMTACAVAMAVWMVSTLSSLQQTVTRIDERQKIVGDNTSKRLDDMEKRLTTLEVLHRKGSNE